MSKDTAAIRDQLGNDPDTFPLLNADHYENFGLEEQSTIWSTETIGDSFILGHSANGVLGTSELGESGRTTTRDIVTNPNQVYHEHFRTTEFKDTSAPNTADWNTTLFRIAMTTETSHATMYNTVSTSLPISYNEVTQITTALLSCTETKYGSDVIKYYLSADNGSNWEEVTNGEIYTFVNTGGTLLFRVIFIGTGANETYIEDIDISYN